MRLALSLSFWLVAASVSAQPDARVGRWLDRAEALLERGDLRRASRFLARASEADPGEPRIVVAIAAGLPADAPAEGVAPERAEWALALLDSLQPRDSSDAHALQRLRGWAMALAGDGEGALRATAGAAGVHDERAARSLRRMAALFVRRGELGLAERALAAALRSWSRDPTLVADAAAVALAQGQPAEAVRLLGAELMHRPRHRALREDLAGALLAAGRPVDALELWRALAADAPAGDIGRLRRSAARAALAAERYETARVEARRALGHDVADGEARLLLGLALVGLERPEHARTALERARARLGADDLRVTRALEALSGDDEPARR